MDFKIGISINSDSSAALASDPIAPPLAAGGIGDQVFVQGVEILPLDLGSDFVGQGLGFALAPTSPQLPAGLSISQSGILSGTPVDESALMNIVIRASNSEGFADSAFSLTVAAPVFNASISNTSLNPDFGLCAQDQTALSAVAAGYSGVVPQSVSYQWKTQESGAIPGANAQVYVPQSASHDGEHLYCSITPAGYAMVDTASFVVRRAAPLASGTLFDEIIDQFPGTETVPTAFAFTGDDLSFSVSGPAGVGIDANTGVVAIETDVAYDGETVTVFATNSGGQAALSFLVTVEANGQFQSLTFGALTRTGAGGVPVSGSSIVSGNGLGHWQISLGEISPTAAAQDAMINSYSLELDDGTLFDIATLADVMSVRADKTEIEAAHTYAVQQRANQATFCSVREGVTSDVINLGGNAMPLGSFTLSGEGFATNGAVRPNGYTWGVQVGGIIMDGNNIHVSGIEVFAPKGGVQSGSGAIYAAADINDFSISKCRIRSTTMEEHVEQMLVAQDPQDSQQVMGIRLYYAGTSGGSNGVIEDCYIHDTKFALDANIDNLLVQGNFSEDTVGGWIVNHNSGTTGMIIKNNEHYGMWASIDDWADQHSGMGGGSLVSGGSGNTGQLIGNVVSSAGWRRKDYEAAQGRSTYWPVDDAGEAPNRAIDMNGTTGFKLNDPNGATNGYDNWIIKHNIFQCESGLGMTVESGTNIDWAYNTLVGDPTSGNGNPGIYMQELGGFTGTTGLRIWKNISGALQNNGIANAGRRSVIADASYDNIQIVNGATVQSGVTNARAYDTYFVGHPVKGLDKLTPEEIIAAYAPVPGSYADIGNVGAVNDFYTVGIPGKGAIDTTPAYDQPTSAGSATADGHAYPVTVWDGSYGLELISDPSHGTALTSAPNTPVPNGKQLLFIAQFELAPSVDDTTFKFLQNAGGGITIERIGAYGYFTVSWERASDNARIVLFNSLREFYSSDGVVSLALSIDVGNDRLCLAVNGRAITAHNRFNDGRMFNDDVGNWQDGNVHMLEGIVGNDRFSGELHYLALNNSFVDLETDAGLEAVFAADGSLRDLTNEGYLVSLSGNADAFNTDNGNATGAAQSVSVTNGGVVTDASGSPETAPVISGQNPAIGATDVATNLNPTISFSKSIAFGTGTVTLRSNNGGWSDAEVFDVTSDTGGGPGTVSISGGVLTIEPTSSLDNQIEYAVRIDATAIEDAAGNSFAGIANDTTISFTTVAVSAPETNVMAGIGSFTSDPGWNLESGLSISGGKLRATNTPANHTDASLLAPGVRPNCPAGVTLSSRFTLDTLDVSKRIRILIAAKDSGGATIGSTATIYDSNADGLAAGLNTGAATFTTPAGTASIIVTVNCVSAGAVWVMDDLAIVY